VLTEALDIHRVTTKVIVDTVRLEASYAQQAGILEATAERVIP